MANPKEQVIDISKLNLAQLNQVKQQLDQEVELFSTSLQQLKMAQTKFQESGESLDKITPENEGKQILVPLTGSMYVPGKLSDVSSVLIDVGTGYYVEKDVDLAKDYFKRKIKFVTDQMEKIQTLAQEKIRLREDETRGHRRFTHPRVSSYIGGTEQQYATVIENMEVRIQAQLASQQQTSSAVKT